MNVIKKASAYWYTIRSMKPSQVYYRLRKMLKQRVSLGVQPAPMPAQTRSVSSVAELDFDPVFLCRFSADELLAGKVTFLYEQEDFCWNGVWEIPERSALWNFNLHYFEFLFPLAKAYKDTGEEKYLEEVKNSILGWIAGNPQSAGGPGWSAYTIALRTVNWLSCLTALNGALEEDAPFYRQFAASVYEQYCFLACHLEKDLLANHYFEDLKALIICALYFGDEGMLSAALKEFKEQCREQVLPDGMHFELSPMYHKIILEDVLRVAEALRGAGRGDAEIENYIQPMLDVAYSFEEGLDRIPLFNDGGDNVAKSLSALMLAAENHFGIQPVYKAQLPDSGYYIFKQGDWKLIVDAGQPGPAYIPGHAHCDALSFELFKDGKPVLVNCGTYAYQCEQRPFFRSTPAHNTVMCESAEQSQCWGVFRMGKRCRVRVISSSDRAVKVEMIDQNKKHVIREFILENDSLTIKDNASCNLTEWIHCAVSWEKEEDGIRLADGMLLTVDSALEVCEHPYACEYGRQQKIAAFTSAGKNSFTINVRNIL